MIEKYLVMAGSLYPADSYVFVFGEKFIPPFPSLLEDAYR
jgi:hypothetical protein